MCGISTICDQFGLTARAVRFYEEKGLIHATRDRFNCRRYDAEARARLGRIAEYRRAGLSLDDIAEILTRGAEGEMAERRCAARKLKARIAEIEAERRHVEGLLERFAAERVVPLREAASRRAAG